jgi:hypothetical protein
MGRIHQQRPFPRRAIIRENFNFCARHRHFEARFDLFGSFHVIFIRKPRGQGVFSKYEVWPSPATAMSANGKFSVIPCALDQRKLLRLGTGALRLRAFGNFENTP